MSCSDYAIIKELGSGGFGSVFLAKNINTGEKVAIKAAKNTYCQGDQIKGEFIFSLLPVSEFDICYRINHKNLLHAADILTPKQLEYCAKIDNGKNGTAIVLSLAEGDLYSHLDDIIKDGNSYDYINTILWLQLHISFGLEALHTSGYYHFDIKPENILIKRDEENRVIPVLSDFSLATDRSVGLLLSEVCTATHRPPEAFGGGKASPAIDVFSLGITFLQMYFYPTYKNIFFNPKNVRFNTKSYPKNNLEYINRILDKELSFNKTSVDYLNFLQQMIHPNPEMRPCLSTVCDFLKSFFINTNVDDSMINNTPVILYKKTKQVNISLPDEFYEMKKLCLTYYPLATYRLFFHAYNLFNETRNMSDVSNVAKIIACLRLSSDLHNVNVYEVKIKGLDYNDICKHINAIINNTDLIITFNQPIPIDTLDSSENTNIDNINIVNNMMYYNNWKDLEDAYGGDINRTANTFSGVNIAEAALGVNVENFKDAFLSVMPDLINDVNYKPDDDMSVIRSRYYLQTYKPGETLIGDFELNDIYNMIISCLQRPMLIPNYYSLLHDIFSDYNIASMFSTSKLYLLLAPCIYYQRI